MTKTTSGWLPDDLELGAFWTLPNLLSLLRFLLAIPVAYLISTDGPFAWIFGLTVIAIASDWFDGQLARWSHSVSKWGKIIDPIADKFAGGLVVFALVVEGHLPGWLIALVAVRDLIILVGGLILTRRIGRVVMSTWVGKAAATALAITVLAALLQADAAIMTWSLKITTALLVLSFVRYLVRFLNLLRREGTRSNSRPRDEASEDNHSEQVASDADRGSSDRTAQQTSSAERSNLLV